MTFSRFVTCVALVLVVGAAGPVDAASLKFTKPNTALHIHGGGTVVVDMTSKQCTDQGGRIANNPSCYSGKQCRGIMNEVCIDKAAAS